MEGALARSCRADIDELVQERRKKKKKKKWNKEIVMNFHESDVFDFILFLFCTPFAIIYFFVFVLYFPLSHSDISPVLFLSWSIVPLETNCNGISQGLNQISFNI